MASKPRTSSTSTTLPVPSGWPPGRRGPTAPTTSRPGGQPASSTWPRRCAESPAGRYRLSSTRRDRVTCAKAWQRCSARPKTWVSARRWALRRDSAPSGSRHRRRGGGTGCSLPRRDGEGEGEGGGGPRRTPLTAAVRTRIVSLTGGSGSVVEHHLAKVRVTGSNPVFRSMYPRARASMPFSLFCCPQQAIHHTPTMTTHTTLPAATRP